MRNTAQYLDAMRTKLGLDSDGQLAVYFGMQRQHMSKYRTGKHTFDDAMCFKVAAILGEKPEVVMVDMMHQRAKSPDSKSAWERAATALYSLAIALVIIAAIPIAHPGNAGLAHAAQITTLHSSNPLYIM